MILDCRGALTFLHAFTPWLLIVLLSLPSSLTLTVWLVVVSALTPP